MRRESLNFTKFICHRISLIIVSWTLPNYMFNILDRRFTYTKRGINNFCAYQHGGQMIVVSSVHPNYEVTRIFFTVVLWFVRLLLKNSKYIWLYFTFLFQQVPQSANGIFFNCSLKPVKGSLYWDHCGLFVARLANWSAISFPSIP